jgi:hypothetical protein
MTAPRTKLAGPLECDPWLPRMTLDWRDTTFGNYHNLRDDGAIERSTGVQGQQAFI